MSIVVQDHLLRSSVDYHAFHVREQVEAELKNLEELDIIERAEGPTPWVSPIVVVPKKTGIRICVDMRAANQAIERERHPVPTVEDLIVDLNGSTVFSKIDLNQGYHQLELEENSRGITTFATHIGLFRYKRLTFGVNSAAEIFQKSIEEVLQGVEGARNISDDIIVFGKSQVDHDEALRAVLQRMRENNLTANPNKCLLTNHPLTSLAITSLQTASVQTTSKFHPSSMPVLPRMQLRHAVFLVWPSTLHASSRTLHPFPLQSVNSHTKMPNGCGAQKNNMHLLVLRLAWQLQKS